MDDSNPYQAPTAQPLPNPDWGQSQVGWPLQVPGVVLIVLASFTLVLFPLSVVVSFVNGTIPDETAQFIGYIAGMVMFMVVNTIVLLGGIAMVKRSAFNKAKAGAIFACIPLCGPCYVLGIPFGIWALVMMAKPEVKAGFNKH